MDDKTMVQPDFMIVCDKEKIIKRKVYGAPDFIVEVLSPSSIDRDNMLKLIKYKDAGLKEYWIVDTKRQKILVYNFSEDFDLSVYRFNDVVPVGLYEGDCIVDFTPYWMRFLFCYKFTQAILFSNKLH
ncbi:Uma2 family endonuclease [Butyrivibrio sp. AE3004]|uniref:Uma2 family endonuclease n=1 Tax=Butyrivibrio sp. AE3004 TaxID=1506994 RepID=UPI002E8DF3DC|nr:Uma2 family endonuclease [Butyrivibrio sp. AE3004]